MKYALIADIHEDITNLKLALNKIEKLGCNEVICLGDISGFSALHYNYYNTRNAHECLNLVRENCKIIIAGNHDLHSIRKVPVISPEFNYPDSWYEMDFEERAAYSKGKVWLYNNDELDPLYKRADIEFLHTIPEFFVLETLKHNIFLSHFIFPNLTGSCCGFYSDSGEFDQHKTFIAENNCFTSFAAHRHFAGLFISSDNRIIEKRYNRNYDFKRNECILIPPITGNQIDNGFCIFDSEEFTVEAKRI